MQKCNTPSAGAGASPSSYENDRYRKCQGITRHLFGASAIMQLITFAADNMPSAASKSYDDLMSAISSGAEAARGLNESAPLMLEDISDALQEMPR